MTDYTLDWIIVYIIFAALIAMMTIISILAGMFNSIGGGIVATRYPWHRWYRIFRVKHSWSVWKSMRYATWVKWGIVAILALRVSASATTREQNSYHTHKLATNSVLISCNDEREPVVKKLDGPFVVISCETR